MDVLAAEERLGLKLPEDVRSFYLWTNGLEWVDSGGLVRWSIEPIDRVDWLENKDREIWFLYKPEDKADARLRRLGRQAAIDGLVDTCDLDLRKAIALSPSGSGDRQWYLDMSARTPPSHRVVCADQQHGRAWLWSSLFQGLSRVFGEPSATPG